MEILYIYREGWCVFGRILRGEPKSSVLRTVDILLPKKKVSLDFLFAILSRLQLTKYITRSTIPHIYFKDESKDKVIVPCLREQKKVAAFLSPIDENIKTLYKQIQGLRTWENGLLQQMFVY